MTRDLADVDPVAVAYAWLRQHPRVLAELGGDSTHVSGIREAPWPHLVVSTAPGGAGDDDHRLQITNTSVEVIVWGHPDGSDSPGKLRRIVLVAVAALLELQTRPYELDQPVVNKARALGVPQRQDLVNGQRRWRQTVTLRMRPPQGDPPA